MLEFGGERAPQHLTIRADHQTEAGDENFSFNALHSMMLYPMDMLCDMRSERIINDQGRYLYGVRTIREDFCHRFFPSVRSNCCSAVGCKHDIK